MGEYALYVYGAYALTFLALAGEVLFLIVRRRALPMAGPGGSEA